MKTQTTTIKAISIILASAILSSSCASTTMIQSTPTGTKVYIDGQSVGTTPYTHSDTKILGSTTTVKLEKDGYETLNTFFSRNEQADIGAIIGGLLIWIPFLWTMKYNPTHTYELVPAIVNQQTTDKTLQLQNPNPINTKSKADRLRELKQLLEDKILTQEEFEKEKAKILAEENK